MKEIAAAARSTCIALLEQGFKSTILRDFTLHTRLQSKRRSSATSLGLAKGRDWKFYLQSNLTARVQEHRTASERH